MLDITTIDEKQAHKLIKEQNIYTGNNFFSKIISKYKL